MTKPRFVRDFHKEWPLHLMILTPLLLLIVYKYIPMGGIVIAFQNYKPGKGILRSAWVGLDNFKMLFETPGFLTAIRNTVLIAVSKLILGVVVPVTFSLMLNEVYSLGAKKVVQTVVYLPHFISWVLMAGIIVRLLSQTGVVNQLLGAFGAEPKVFLADKAAFPYVIIITDVWKEFGYGTIIYLAAITGVNPSLYEAAEVDGAGHLQRLWHVTLPGLAPTIVLMSALALGRVLEAGFDQIFNLYSPIVYETGDIIDTFVYRMAFGNGRFSISTAASLFKSVIACTLTVLSYRIAYRTTGYRIF